MNRRSSELIFGPSTTIRTRNDSGNRNNTVVASDSGSGDEGNDDAEVGNTPSTLTREEVRAAAKRLLEKWCFEGIYPPNSTSKSNTSSSRASEGTKGEKDVTDAATTKRVTPIAKMSSSITESISGFIQNVSRGDDYNSTIVASTALSSAQEHSSLRLIYKRNNLGGAPCNLWEEFDDLLDPSYDFFAHPVVVRQKLMVCLILLMIFLFRLHQQIQIVLAMQKKQQLELHHFCR
mmetsp:Transcript_35857/g.36078  ORF Transcript_35857/g.36078 Transcript_35857/m.36078 type:complete len:234 (-) Transcript_35857:72-773(-)